MCEHEADSAGFLCGTECQAFKQLIHDCFLRLNCDFENPEEEKGMWKKDWRRLYDLQNTVSSLRHIPVISAKVKFYRWSITHLKSVCLMCLDIWNLTRNRLSFVPYEIYLFKECRPCVHNGQPCSGMWSFKNDLRVMGENYSCWGLKAMC